MFNKFEAFSGHVRFVAGYDFQSKQADYYRPPTKLWEGNVFKGVCVFTDGGYACSQVLSGGWYAWSRGSGYSPLDMGHGRGVGTHPWKVHPPILTSSGGHQSGRYAS